MADGWVLKINGDSKGAVRAVDDLGDSTKTLTGRERALVGVLAGVAAATAVAMKAAINYGDWLEKTAQKTGVSTEALSSYKLGAELAGTTQEGLISGLQRLQKNMGAALRSPTSAAATAFKSLGVEFQNADGSLRDVEDLLPDVAAAMAGMADATECGNAPSFPRPSIRRLASTERRKRRSCSLSGNSSPCERL